MAGDGAPAEGYRAPETESPTTSFAEFVEGSYERLLRLAYLLVGDLTDAEDLVQTALERCCARWSRVRAESAYGYVVRTMVNTRTNRWRQTRRHEQVLLDDRIQPVDSRDPTVELAERDALWAHVLALPPRQRAVIVLRYYEDLSEAQIARVLGLAAGTVKSQASRALTTLRTAHTTQPGVQPDRRPR